MKTSEPCEVESKVSVDTLSEPRESLFTEVKTLESLNDKTITVSTTEESETLKIQESDDSQDKSKICVVSRDISIGNNNYSSNSTNNVPNDNDINKNMVETIIRAVNDENTLHSSTEEFSKNLDSDGSNLEMTYNGHSTDLVLTNENNSLLLSSTNTEHIENVQDSSNLKTINLSTLNCKEEKKEFKDEICEDSVGISNTKVIFQEQVDSPSNSLLDIKTEGNDVFNESSKQHSELLVASNTTSTPRSFSPIPSTSRDNFIIDINDSRFNKANIISGPTVVSENIEDITNTEPDKESLSQTLNIIECSSGSDSGNDVIVSSDVQKSTDIIDLLLEDSNDKLNDSDCEIVDVDSLLAENKAVLNKISDHHVSVSPTEFPHLQLRPVLPQNSDEEIIWADLSAPEIPFSWDNAAFDKMKTIVKDFFVRHFPISLEKKQVITSEIEHVLPGDTENHKRRISRDRFVKHKRKKILDVIDLSCASSVKSQGTSEVIVIDSDTSLNLGNTSVVEEVVDPSASVSISAAMDSVDKSEPRSDVSPKKMLGDCPVCLENFSKTQAVSTFCGHIFCLPCMTYIKSTTKKCPSCRKPLRGKGFHQIFL